MVLDQATPRSRFASLMQNTQAMYFWSPDRAITLYAVWTRNPFRVQKCRRRILLVNFMMIRIRIVRSAGESVLILRDFLIVSVYFVFSSLTLRLVCTPFMYLFSFFLPCPTSFIFVALHPNSFSRIVMPCILIPTRVSGL